MSDNEETYFRSAKTGANLYKRTGDTALSLEWIDDLEGIAFQARHPIAIKALRELDKLAKASDEEISAKAGEALERAMSETRV